ncbi:MAG: hypothetical protein GQ547_06305 [Methylophaga sp.]|nr:hypothetical protein [Methylophaga sp.]
MGSSALIYQEKFKAHLSESLMHIKRLNNAIAALEKKYTFPLVLSEFKEIVNCDQDLAFVDQVIYRFSKLQDSMGAKLFKSYLLAQGENVDKPFLDILNQLEKLHILDVDEWFEFRDIRNSISHHYEDDVNVAIDLVNMIYKSRNDLERILKALQG